jgi:hypothetical protein
MLERAGLGLTVTFSVFALSNAASACDWRVGGCGPYGYYPAPFVRYYAPPPVYYAPVVPRFGYYATPPVYGYAPPVAYGYAYYPTYYYRPRSRFSPN